MTTLGMSLQRLSWDQFPSANATSRNSKYTDLCLYCLAASEEVFRFISCPQICPSSYKTNDMLEVLKS